MVWYRMGSLVVRYSAYEVPNGTVSMAYTGSILVVCMVFWTLLTEEAELGLTTLLGIAWLK